MRIFRALTLLFIASVGVALPIENSRAQLDDQRRYVLIAVAISKSGESRPIPCPNCSFNSPQNCDREGERMRSQFEKSGVQIVHYCVDRNLR